MQTILTPQTMVAGYLALSILAAIIVHLFSLFDFRQLAVGADDGFGPSGFFEYPDRGLLVLVFGLLGVGFAAYLGWRIPLEIQRVAEGQAFRPIMPDVSLDSLGRAAQIVGAICFGLISLRLLRISLILAFALTMLALSVAAYNYVFV